MNEVINKIIDKNRLDFDIYFKRLLLSNLPNIDLSEIILYGALNGGKRIRPFLVSIFSKIAKLPKRNYYRVSAAIECIHSYSLIHDDLPCMDDDDFRRGKLSVHKKFNEAQAILAGDSLHDIAFELISDQKTYKDPLIRIKLVNLLSNSLGAYGLAGGQSLDLFFENKKTNRSNIIKMYKMKTGALFSFCCIAPFIISNKSKSDLIFAKKYGEIFGLVFQIIDDLLDETANYNKLGKTPGKDKRQGKSTILNYMKKKDVKIYCNKIVNNFIKKNKKKFNKWKILQIILFGIINRNA